MELRTVRAQWIGGGVWVANLITYDLRTDLCTHTPYSMAYSVAIMHAEVEAVCFFGDIYMPASLLHTLTHPLLEFSL